MVNLNSRYVMINTVKKALIAGGCAAMLALGTNTVVAQGRGDPAQFRQRMMDDLKESLEVKDDAEWTALEPKISKVFDARRDVMAATMRGFGRGGGRNRQRGGGGDDQGTNNSDQQRRPRGGGMFGAEPSAAVTALQKAVDDKAPTAEIKAKLKVVQDEAKAKETALVAAQEDLRAILTPRQEAIATLHGLL
jgi:hypothetical protein